jgi:hypothetical protein
MRTRMLLSLALLCAVCAAAGAEITRFQNGVAPAKEYAGCVDTRISIYNDGEARVGRQGKAQNLLTFSTARRILVRFDLAAVPRGRSVRRALLRVYCTAPTSLRSKMFAAPLTRSWDESATGFEHNKTDDDKGPDGNWAKKGGDYDEKALVEAPCRGGAFGHAFEFDLTAVVGEWLAGKRPNHGVILWSSQHTQHAIASSEWPMSAYRPALLIDHAPGGQPDAPAGLEPFPAPPKQVQLSPAAGTGEGGKVEGEYVTVSIGMNARCNLRGGADAYVKTSPKLAGRWGWMPHLRVGGGAGDFNAALLSFDLSGVPKGASIKSAKLRLNVVTGSRDVRFGAYLARAGAPAWEAQTVSLTEAEAGTAWGEGGCRGAFQEDPVAVATVTFPARNAPDQQPYVEWDLTGAVRASAGGTLSLLIAHDVEGGAFDAYSAKYDDPEQRPALTIEVSPAPKLPKLEPLRGLHAPTGEYWVEPMREVHKRFKGTPNALGQYGDSITITMAFLATHSSGSCIPAKCPPDVRRKLQIVDENARKDLWRKWKYPKYGNNGSMTVAWAFANVDAWQQLCRPEVAVILFGTNDVSYGPVPPDYTEYMTYVVDRCLADGTIPILTTLPPRGDQKGDAPHNKRILQRVLEIRRAQIAIARARKIPLIDFYDEILARQPANWDKLLMGDNLHPSYRDPWKMDYTEEGLANSGYTLRNYLTMMKYAEIMEKVTRPGEGSEK